jgi:multidrug transporter EmrE-like cation transporter
MKTIQTITAIIMLCLAAALFILDAIVAQSMISLAYHIASMIGATGATAFGVFVFMCVPGSIIVIGILLIAVSVLFAGIALLVGTER